MGISWHEARSLAPIGSWRGAKAKITSRLRRLKAETDPSKREKLADEVSDFVDFLYDSTQHLKGQVDKAREALHR